MSAVPKFRRVMLKISGEGLMGSRDYGLDPATVQRVASEIKAIGDHGVHVCCVVGGGNIFRGVSGAAKGMERAAADTVGMLATVMNALSLQNALEDIGVETRVQSALNMPSVCETFVRRRALRHLEKNRVVIFAAGTGNPFFTTDTAAALRAVEMGCDALFKASQVDGIYSADPKKDKQAIRYDHLTYRDVLTHGLAVMDAAAVALCQENEIPVIVFDMHQDGAFLKAILGEGRYTIISGKG